MPLPERPSMENLVVIAARTAHEANRSICSYMGVRQPHWKDMTEDYKARTIEAVKAIQADPKLTPEGHHKRWMKAMKDAGWTKGKVRCHELKQSPCLVPYADLSPMDKAKSVMFLSVVKAVLAVKV